MKITKQLKTEIIEHAKALTPVESCGYLAGKDSTLSKLYKMTNLDNAADHFTFDPKEQFAALKDARNQGLQLLSVYHSHPESPARLSQEDLKLLIDPNMIYLIVSLEAETPDVKAFKTKDNKSISIPLEEL